MSTRYEVLGNKYEVLDTFYLVLDTVYLVLKKNPLRNRRGLLKFICQKNLVNREFNATIHSR